MMMTMMTMTTVVVPERKKKREIESQSPHPMHFTNSLLPPTDTDNTVIDHWVCNLEREKRKNAFTTSLLDDQDI
jgi:hypothetical protein